MFLLFDVASYENRMSKRANRNRNTGKPVHCYYCPNCTTHIYHEQTALGDKVIARTSLLDSDGSKGFKPAVEIYGKERYNFLPEVAKTFETLPPM